MAADVREGLIAELYELIAALQRRVPQLEREGETQIASDAACLTEKALQALAQLEEARPTASR